MKLNKELDSLLAYNLKSEKEEVVIPSVLPERSIFFSPQNSVKQPTKFQIQPIKIPIVDEKYEEEQKENKN